MKACEVSSWSDSAPSSWHHHFILFLSAKNVIIEHISAVTEDEICNTMKFTPAKAFMDDIFLMSLSIPATQALLGRCVIALI